MDISVDEENWFFLLVFAAIMADYFLSLNVASSKQLVDKARGVFHR